MDWSWFVYGFATGCVSTLLLCLCPSLIKCRCFGCKPKNKFMITFPPFEDKKVIVDELGYTVCLICIEKITTSTVECTSCSKYIGHTLCITKWFEVNPICPQCRS